MNMKKVDKYETIYLLLYGRDHTVFEKSGLNQWNAKGRVRNLNEVYIPVPARNTSFNLKLLDGKITHLKYVTIESRL